MNNTRLSPERVWEYLPTDAFPVRLYYTAVNNATKSASAEMAPNSNVASAIEMPKLSRWRRMQIPVIAWAAYWLVRLLGPTLRLEILGVQNAVQLCNSWEHGV